MLGDADHRTAGADRNLDDGGRRVGGVLLVTEDDIGRHGLDVEHLEGVADLLVHMCAQGIGNRGLASRNLDIHTGSNLPRELTWCLLCTHLRRYFHGNLHLPG